MPRPGRGGPARNPTAQGKASLGSPARGGPSRTEPARRGEVAPVAAPSFFLERPFSSAQEFPHGRADVVAGHEGFADKHGMDSGRLESFDVGAGADAAFGQGAA